MTISSTTRVAGPFTGNGSTTVFPFTFKVFASTDVQVIYTDLSGVETIKTLTTDYIVTLNASQDSSPGGSITMQVAPVSGALITITSAVEEKQSVLLANNGGFYPTVINDALDKLTIIIQQIKSKVSRSLSIPVSSSVGVNTELPAPQASSIIGWNSAANKFQNYPLSSVGSSVQALTYQQGAVGSVIRSVQSKLQDTVSVKDFGAVCDGVSDDYSAIQSAIDYAYTVGGATVIAPGVCKVSAELLLKTGVDFKFNKLIPSSASVNVLRMYGGCTAEGEINTLAFPTYSGNAFIIDGNGESNSCPFRLHIKSEARVSVIAGGSTGTAIYFKATAASARIMGFSLYAKVSGFQFGVFMEQTSADLSKFITSNYIELDTSDTIVAIGMYSSQANFYGIDGNHIVAKGQPKPGTTSQLYKLCGQDNTFDLIPWDWDAVSGTAAFAATLDAYSRRNIFKWHTSWNYFLNSSADASNLFFSPFDSGIRLQSIASSRSDSIVPFSSCVPGLDNNKYYSIKGTDGNYKNIIGVDASNNLMLLAPSMAGAGIYFDTSNATGVYAFRTNGTNRAFISSTSVTPGADNSIFLGTQGARWANVYASNVTLTPAASVTPANNGDMTFELTSNTSLKIKVKGSDGVLRSATIALA